MDCYLQEEEYYFSYQESGKSYYGCKNESCNQDVFDDVSNILFTESTFENKKDQVRIYFVNNNGTCDER